MTVRVLFFASLREALGTGEIELTVTSPLSVDELLHLLAERLPAAAVGALHAENVRLAVNQTLVAALGVRIRPGDEIAFLPPVTGG